jgi:hypothetical protein
MIVGAEAEGGVSLIPAQPASPIAVISESKITNSVPIVALIDRNN